MQFHQRCCALAVEWVIGFLFICQFVTVTHAQTTNIVPSINEASAPQNGLGTMVVQSGHTFNIEGGTRPFSGNDPGPNVFHSFGSFNLGAGDIANFVQPDAAATTVISRVIGGRSNINGTIQALGWSNFYFINPSGVIFGPSATLNIPNGSVYISTAKEIFFVEGPAFTTESGGSPSAPLSVAAVSSFGFTGNSETPSTAVAPIAINGSNLTVASKKTLAVIGGPITIDGAKLTAPNGRVQVASVASFVGYGGEVNAESLEMTPFQNPLGNISSGTITMSPGNSFAALDAGPQGVVQTNPPPASIQHPPGSQKTVQPNLVIVLSPGGNPIDKLSPPVQSPTVLAVPRVAFEVPGLLADRCAGGEDGRFSSFVQLNRDSTPSPPGRYLSSPFILGEDLFRTGQGSVPERSISMQAPPILAVPHEATFLAMNECGR